MRTNAVYHRRIRLGLCTECGEDPPQRGLRLCRECRRIQKLKAAEPKLTHAEKRERMVQRLVRVAETVLALRAHPDRTYGEIALQLGGTKQWVQHIARTYGYRRGKGYMARPRKAYSDDVVAAAMAAYEAGAGVKEISRRFGDMGSKARPLRRLMDAQGFKPRRGGRGPRLQQERAAIVAAYRAGNEVSLIARVAECGVATVANILHEALGIRDLRSLRWQNKQRRWGYSGGAVAAPGAVERAAERSLRAELEAASSVRRAV